ncbi:MAG: iron complex outermembrane receptor protein [Pseudomonadales bacterium]|jgi:iron complex outermembrane receptor protein
MNPVTKKFLPSILSVAVASILATSTVFSQGILLEEVIVTAQKREENLQDTAIAITAFTSETLDQLNISTASDYEALVPSLSFRNQPSRLSIRGIGRTSNSLGLDPGVAVYRDGVYNAETGILGRATSLTTERIEILRGPQGTLFGRNATGGAVSITSKRPTDEFEHHVRAEVGSYNQFDYGASSSGPITDDLRYFVAGEQTSRDGYIENVNGGELWEDNDWAAQVQLSWDVTEYFNVWVQYFSEGRDINSASGYGLSGHLLTPYDTATRSPDGLVESPAFNWTESNPTASDPYKVDYNTIGTFKTEATDNITAHLTYDFDNLTIKYIGASHELKSGGSGGDRDYTSNADHSITVGGNQNSSKDSHEIQFISTSDIKLQWVAGLFYFSEDTEQPYRIKNITNDGISQIMPPGVFSYDPALAIANPDYILYSQLGELETTSKAVYLDGSYQINDNFKLIVGARYSEDEKIGYENQFTYADGNLYGLFANDEGCCALDSSEEINERTHKGDWSDTSGRIVLDYTPDDNQLIYGSISTGYKSGGFRLGEVQEDPIFDPEDITSYEIGYKATFNDTILINAAVYHYDYKDMQVSAGFLNNQGLSLVKVINADEAEIDGLELETTWIATENLRLMLAYSYIDGEYTDFCCVIDTVANPGVEQDLSGTDLVQAPKNKVSLNANYTWFTDTMGDFSISGNYSFVDERSYSIFESPRTTADSYYRADMALTWYSSDSDIRVVVAGKNITDEQTFTSLTLGQNDAVTGMPNEPRVYSLEVQYDF